MKKLATALALATMLLVAGCSTKQQTINHSEYQTKDQQNMERAYQFIKDCGYYFIATEEGNQARVRPFGTVHIFEGKLYIQTGHIKNVAKQIAENPNVELCAYNGSQWIRLSGTLVDDERIEAKKSMLDEYPNLRSMYDENDENTAVFYFTNAVARICSFTTDEEVIEF